MPVKEGDTIKVEYKGTLDDGTVFDSSENHGRLLEFEVGAGQIIAGFENAVIGMENGEEKDVKLQPSEAYGESDPRLIQRVPKSQFPEEIKPGMMLLMTLPNGVQVPLKIVDVTEDEVTIDLNHPLAGKNLNFRIKVVDIAS